MRQSRDGIYVYREDGTTELPLTEARGSHSPELDELYDALVARQAAPARRRLGLATLEVSLAIMQSAREHRDIEMRFQVPVPDWA